MSDISAQYAVFDFGGVLFKTSRKALYQELFVRKGRSEDDLNYFLNVVFPREVASVANLGTMAAVTKTRAQEYPEWADEIMAFNADRDFAKQVTGPIEGMPEVLSKLASKGVKIFGLTNWASDTFQVLPKAYPEMIDRFDKVIVSGVLGMKKPDPRIFEWAAQEMGNPLPSQVHYFDDKLSNTDAATRSVGWNGHVFNANAGGVGMVVETFAL